MELDRLMLSNTTREKNEDHGFFLRCGGALKGEEVRNRQALVMGKYT